MQAMPVQFRYVCTYCIYKYLHEYGNTAPNLAIPCPCPPWAQGDKRGWRTEYVKVDRSQFWGE